MLPQGEKENCLREFCALNLTANGTQPPVHTSVKGVNYFSIVSDELERHFHGSEQVESFDEQVSYFDQVDDKERDKVYSLLVNRLFES